VDVEMIYVRLRKAMIEREVTSLAALSAQTGLSATVVKRMSYGAAPDAHNLAALLHWLGEETWWIKPRTRSPDADDWVPDRFPASPPG
jgi:hypothetical protein